MRKYLMAGLVLVAAGVLWAHLPGRVTGGPSIINSDGTLVTSGFELYCQPEAANASATPVFGPNNLEVNWSGNHWHMTQLRVAICTSDGENPAPPANTATGPDTITLTGVGECNGVENVPGTFTFVDHGEPGIGVDKAGYSISAVGACPGLNTGALRLISDGNVQFHTLQPNP